MPPHSGPKCRVARPRRQRRGGHAHGSRRSPGRFRHLIGRSERSSFCSRDLLLLLVDCYSDTAACVRRLLEHDGRFALLLNAATFHASLNASKRRSVLALSAPFYLFPVTTYFARDHPLVDAYSAQAMRLQSAGIIRHAFSRFRASRAPRPYAAIARRPRKLQLQDVAPCAYVLLIGLSVACVGFAAELVVIHLFPRIALLANVLFIRTSIFQLRM